MITEKQAKDYVTTFFAKDHTGHDMSHIQRVVSLSTIIAKEEQLSSKEQENIRILAYLHEMLDKKFFPNVSQAKKRLQDQFILWGETKIEAQQWIEAILAISFSNRTKENDVAFWIKVVQDADLLEAIGSIGIARTFMYGAIYEEKMYDEQKKGIEKSSIIQHFYDKLLHIPALLSSESGKKLGMRRKKMMDMFLKEFYLEWQGK